MNTNEKPVTVNQPQNSDSGGPVEPGAGNGRPQPAQAQSQRRPGAMFGHGGPRALMPGEKSRDFKGTMKQLFAYLGPYRWGLLAVMVLATVATILAIVGPKILGTATTDAL